MRNSGSLAVIEGYLITHGCEYMTGGYAFILGDIGDNFAAGMTGGMAFVYDPKNKFENYVNPASVVVTSRNRLLEKFLLDNLKNHFKETKSITAKKIIDNFKSELNNFKQVCPIEMLDKLDHPITLSDNKKYNLTFFGLNIFTFSIFNIYLFGLVISLTLIFLFFPYNY